MWCLIPPKDFLILMEKYDEINFENILVKDNLITIDNQISVFYPHYIKSDNEEPVVEGVDVRVKDLTKYTEKKYLDRLSRMKNNNTPPVFIISSRQNGYTKYVFNDFDLLKNLKPKYKTYVLVDKNKTVHNKNLSTIQVNDTDRSVTYLATRCLEDIGEKNI